MSNKISQLTVEYMLVIDSVNNFCSNEDSFNNLITSYSDIRFNKNKEEIIYKESTFLYKLYIRPLNNEENNTKNVFDVHFTCNNIDQIEEFRGFLKIIKGFLRKISEEGSPYLLRDDITFYYSEKAYPKVHEIENLMRKLINKFMILNVGIEWTKEYIPNGSEGQKSTTDYLYSLNINQLSDILFEEYSPNSTNELLEKIEKANAIEELSLDDLKKYVKKSNWDRIFKDKAGFPRDYLESRWKVICAKRNIIAHNKPLKIDEYKNLLKKIEEVKVKLNMAISNLDDINIAEEEKRMISRHLVLEDIGIPFGASFEGNSDVIFINDLKGQLEFIEWKIIQLINQDLTESSLFLDENEEQKADAATFSSEFRIKYLLENTDLIPSRVLNEIVFLFETIPNFEKWKEKTTNKEFRKMLIKCSEIAPRISKYLSARTLGLD